jgi:hypothetical protein
MATIWEKLNLKGHQEIVVLNAPDSFAPQLAQLAVLNLHQHIQSLATLRFALLFVTCQRQIDALVPLIAARAYGDAIIWFAYPKAASKKYSCDFNRDTGWDLLRAAGFDTVRAVAIDEDWTALRFRRKEFIQPR